MTHDPKCPWGAEGDPDKCYRIEGLEHPMTVCELIYAVREDDKSFRRAQRDDWEDLWYQRGYLSALHDASTAINQLRGAQ